MKLYIQVLLVGIFSTLVACSPLYGADNNSKEHITGLELVNDTVQFDGITIKNFTFGNQKKYIFAGPEEEITTHMHYTIDSDQLATLHLHHFVIGLHDDGPQSCILHALGIRNSQGTATVTLKTPKRKGVYQVRLSHSVGLTHEEAFNAWWRSESLPSKTIVGIIVVK
jgi:hypothetical protein